MHLFFPAALALGRFVGVLVLGVGLGDGLLPAFDLGALLPAPFADIGISEVEIAVKLIPARAAGLVVLLVIRIVGLIQIAAEVVLVFLPKLILLVLALVQLLHAGAALGPEGHRLYRRLDHLRRPFLRLFLTLPILQRCRVLQILFFLLLRHPPFLRSPFLAHYFAAFFFLFLRVAFHRVLKITFRNHYRHIK